MASWRSDFVRRKVPYPDYGLVVSHGGLYNLKFEFANCRGFYQGGDCNTRYTVCVCVCVVKVSDLPVTARARFARLRAGLAGWVEPGL